PPGKINRLQARFNLLHCLVARQGAQGVDVVIGVQTRPQLFGALLRQSMCYLHRASKTDHFFRPIAAFNALPARAFSPMVLKGAYLLFSRCHEYAPESVVKKPANMEKILRLLCEAMHTYIL